MKVMCPNCGEVLVTMARVEGNKLLKRLCCPNCRGKSYIVKLVVEVKDGEVWAEEV